MNYQKTIFIALIILVAILEVGGDILFKKWSIDGRNYILYIGLFLYLLAAGTWAMSMRYEFLSKAIIIFTIANLILGVMAGMLIFGEQLTVQQKLGVVVGLIAVVMIEM